MNGPFHDLEQFDRASVREAIVCAARSIGAARGSDRPVAVQADRSAAFLERFDRSEAVGRLLELSEELDAGAIRWALWSILASFKHLDVSVNGVSEQPESPAKLRAKAKRVEKALDVLLSDLGLDLSFFPVFDIVRLWRDRAEEIEETRRLKKESPRPPGRSLSAETWLAGALDLFLRDLAPGDRLKLTAALITDFIRPITPEQVRQLLKDYRRRRSSKAQR